MKTNLRWLLYQLVFPGLDKAHGQDVRTGSTVRTRGNKTTLLSSLLCFFPPSGCGTINAALPSFLLLCFGSLCQAVNPKRLKSGEWQGWLRAGSLPEWFVAAAVGDSGCVICPLWSGVGGQPWSAQTTQKTQLSPGLLLKAGLL